MDGAGVPDGVTPGDAEPVAVGVVDVVDVADGDGPEGPGLAGVGVWLGPGVCVTLADGDGVCVGVRVGLGGTLRGGV